MTQPTLILGVEPRIVIPIARSLSERDVKVTVAAFGGDAKRVGSRAVHQFIVVPDPHDEPERFLSSMTELIRKEQFDFLIPCGDSALVAASQFYDQFRDLLHVSCPPPQIVQRVLDKRATLEIAARCGVPIPATFWISSLAELEVIRNKLIFPIVRKPSNKQKENADKVRYFHSYEELSNALTAVDTFGEEIMLQQYCEGEGTGIESLFHKGEPIALFQHRRIRELPSTGGVSVVALSEPLDSHLVKFAVTLLRGLEWEGVAMVEFKHNRANRKATLMEVNGRYWGSVAVAIHAGVNFPLYDWQLAHGEMPQPPPSYKPGVRVRWMTGDFKRLDDLRFETGAGGFGGKSWMRELAEFLSDFRPSTRDMVWSWRDPLPAIQEMTVAFAEIAKRRLKATVRRMVPNSFLKRVKDYRSLEPPVSHCYFQQRVRHILMPSRKSLPKSVQSILFVCHDNIIRGPMAEALFRRSSSLACRSAGLHARAGRGAEKCAVRVAREFGVCLECHVATELTPEIVALADLIFVMDALNEARFLSRFPQARGKLFLLGAFAPKALPYDEIPDPYGGSEQAVRECFRNLDTCIAEAVSEIRD